MAANVDFGPALLAKQLGGMFTLILGCLLTAAGLALDSMAALIVGVFFLVLGVLLFAMKIIRRNRHI